MILPSLKNFIGPVKPETTLRGMLTGQTAPAYEKPRIISFASFLNKPKAPVKTPSIAETVFPRSGNVLKRGGNLAGRTLLNFLEPVGERFGSAIRSVQTKSLTPLKESVAKQKAQLFPQSGDDLKTQVEKLSNIALMANVDTGLLGAFKKKPTAKPTKVIKPKQVKQSIKIDPLISEARKYKSAEEFLSTQKPVFRGATSENMLKDKGRGISFATDKDVATRFSTRDVNGFPQKGSVGEFYLKPDAKILDPKILTTKMIKGDMTRENIIKYARDNNYDAVDLTQAIDPKLGFKPENELRILNTDALKTKSQLTDIWNKANAADPLISEARKYKSAEEFVKAQGTPVYHGSPSKIIGELKSSKELGTSQHTSKFGGVFFSENKAVADAYSKLPNRANLSQIKRPEVSNYVDRLQKKITEYNNTVDELYQGFDKQGWIVDNNFERYVSAERGGKPIKDKIAKIQNEIRDIKKTAPDLTDTEKSLLYGNANTQEVVLIGDVIDINKRVGFSENREALIEKYKGKIIKLKDGNNQVEYIATDPSQIKTKSQLTDIWNKANQASASGNVPSVQKVGTQAIESNQSPLASLNLSRTVAEQPPIPTQSKVVSYPDSITKPIISKANAKEAFIRSEPPAKAPKNPALVAGAENFKDISGFKGQTRDVYRNFRAFFKDKFPEVKKQILDPFDAAKGRYVDEQKTILADLKATIVDGFGIKKGSKESAAVMDFGEKVITKDELIKKFGDTKAKQIIQADEWFRSKYDSYLEEVNAIRKQIYPRSPDKIIPKRQDYYRHFQELTGLGGLKNIFETPAGIDPTLAGISAFTQPKSKFLSFAQKRIGNRSSRDAVGGFLEYIPSYSYAKHIDPQIGKFRDLASDLAIQTQNTRNANNFIEYLGDFANDLSGKTNAADRFVQKIIGRKAFGVINWLNNRVKANTILGNASSSIAQIFNVPQGVASAKLYSVPGAVRTLGGIFTENTAMKKSSFINERYSNSMYNAFEESMLAKPKMFASWMTGVMDEVGTKFIWNSHYVKAQAKNLPNPVKYADDVTRSLVAGRGIGEVPLLQKSKLFQLAAPFQLEVGNLWYVIGDQVKAKDFSGIATLFVANYLMNRVAEKVRGSDVVFDPINAVYEGVMALQNEENKKRGAAKLGGRVVGEAISNIPGGQTLAAMYPENGWGALGGMSREELFGEGDPTRFGGGLLAIKGLQDPLFKVLPPFGGAQLKKTLQGAGAYLEGRVTDKKDKLQFDIEQTPQNLLRSILFGKYATPEAKEYSDQQNPQGVVEKEVSPEEQRIRPVYDEAQRLKAQGKIDEATEMVNELPDADKETYKKIKAKELKVQKDALIPKVLEVYKDAQVLKAEGKIEEATRLVNEQGELEKAVYEDLKKKYKDTKITDLLNEGVDKPADTSETSFIKDVLTYAKAIGSDPVTAFNRIITGQKIRRVDNGAIIVERVSLDESQSIKKNRGAASTLKLDHTIPLQLGGSNSENNLKLVTNDEWVSYTPVENKLGSLLRAKKISKREAQKLIKEFKEGKITAESILSKE